LREPTRLRSLRQTTRRLRLACLQSKERSLRLRSLRCAQRRHSRAKAARNQQRSPHTDRDPWNLLPDILPEIAVPGRSMRRWRSVGCS